MQGNYLEHGVRLEDQHIAAKANAEAAKALAEPDGQAAAKRELARMKRSLKSWLRYRRKNDRVARGEIKARVPAYLAARTLQRDRDYAGEQKLADDLYVLLSQLHNPAELPVPDVAADPNAAVKLATIAITGTLGAEASGPQAQGIVPLVIMVAGGVLLLTATSFISNRAEVQKEKERLKCIRDGACTDYGFWLKAASVAVLGYFVWEKTGLGKKVKRKIARA